VTFHKQSGRRLPARREMVCGPSGFSGHHVRFLARENEREGISILPARGNGAFYDTEEMNLSAGDQIRITEGFQGERA